MILYLYRVCTVNGVPLQSGFSCPAIGNITNTSSTCDPDTPRLQNIFSNAVITMGIHNTTVYDDDSGWQNGFAPVCRDGIPGITSSRTIVGELMCSCYSNNILFYI